VALPPKSSLGDILFAWIGGFIAIAIIGYLTKSYDNLLVMERKNALIIKKDTYFLK